MTISTLGRLASPEQFADIIVKTGLANTVTQTAAGSTDSQGGANGPGGSGTITGASSQTGPTPQSTGIVRLRDVVTRAEDDPSQPRIELGSQQYDQSCTLDRKPSVALSIFQLPGYNALKTAKDVRAKMKELK